jgi:hypothetical protein
MRDCFFMTCLIREYVLLDGFLIVIYSEGYYTRMHIIDKFACIIIPWLNG